HPTKKNLSPQQVLITVPKLAVQKAVPKILQLQRKVKRVFASISHECESIFQLKGKRLNIINQNQFDQPTSLYTPFLTLFHHECLICNRINKCTVSIPLFELHARKQQKISDEPILNKKHVICSCSYNMYTAVYEHQF